MEKPIFVIGSMGSGTTLLRLMLDSHPNIMIAQETGFLRSVMAQYHVPFWKFGGEWLERIGMTDAELDESCRAFYDDVFSKAAAKRGATRWGDKTPYHVHHMELAARVFPDAQFIATVRHPGAVANSVGRFHWDWNKGIEHWTHSNQNMIDAGITLGDRFHLIRYEDLVTDPEPVIREVLAFLGEPWKDEVLSHHEVQPGGVAEGGTKASDPIDTARMSKWLSAVNDKQLARLVKRTDSQARVFGYSAAEPLPIEPVSIPGSDLIGVTGDGLRQRYEQAQPVRRVDINMTFENRPYTVMSMAEELRKAFTAGMSGGSVRPAYRKEVEAGLPPRAHATTTVARVRRRLARAINPDM